MKKPYLLFSVLVAFIVLAACFGETPADDTNGDGGDDTDTTGNGDTTDLNETPYPTGGMGVKSLDIDCYGTSMTAKNNGSVSVTLDFNQIRDTTNVVSHVEGQYVIPVGGSQVVPLRVDIRTDPGNREFRLMFIEINERGGRDYKYIPFEC